MGSMMNDGKGGAMDSGMGRPDWSADQFPTGGPDSSSDTEAAPEGAGTQEGDTPPDGAETASDAPDSDELSPPAGTPALPMSDENLPSGEAAPSDELLFPGQIQSGQSAGGFSDITPTQTPSFGASAFCLMGISCLILLGGILLAVRFPRRRG